MPLYQNVSGTLKKITKPTQNVSGVLKGYNSYKINVSGTLKELLTEAPFVAPTLTWTASNSLCRVSSQTNSGKNVSAAIYNNITSNDVSNDGRVYSNTFYIPAGNVINITYSASCSASTAKAFGIYLVSSDGTAHTIAKGTTLDGTASFEVPSSGNYYFVITGFGMTVTGSASGATTTTYYDMNITATIAFNEDSGGTTTTSMDLLTAYPALSSTLSGTAYQGSSNTADSTHASISIDKSKYKYITITVKTTSYCSINYSCELVFNGKTVSTIDLTGAAGNSTDTITIANSALNDLNSNILTSCYIYLRYTNGNGATTSISATVTTLKFHN